MTDEQLIEKCASGCQDSFAELDRRYRAPLTARIAKQLWGDWAQAEDVVQNVLLRILRYASKFDPSKSCAANWIALQAKQETRNMIRHRKAKPLLPVGDGAYSDPIDANAVDPGKQAAIAELRRRVSESIESLDSRYRETAQMIVLDDLTYREAATLTGVPVSTLKHRMQTLRKCWGLVI